MSLTSGTRLGPYEVIAPRGAGGLASVRAFELLGALMNVTELGQVLKTLPSNARRRATSFTSPAIP